jgi:hypothetical protein
MMALFIVVGVFLGLVLKPRAKNQVMKLIPRDKRFIDFNVSQENAFSLECESEKGFPPQRFIKHAPGFTGKLGRVLKRTVTRYLGREGTAFTSQVIAGKIIIGSLAKTIRGLWGEEFYFTVPEEQRIQLEESKINVTVELDKTMTPEGYKAASEEDIKQEQDRAAAETWWKGKKMAEKTGFMQVIFIFGAGAGAMAVASKFLGWW